MKKIFLVNRKGLYESPSAEIVCISEETNFLGSDGNTEDYGEVDPWDIPDND